MYKRLSPTCASLTQSSLIIILKFHSIAQNLQYSKGGESIQVLTMEGNQDTALLMLFAATMAPRKIIAALIVCRIELIQRKDYPIIW